LVDDKLGAAIVLEPKPILRVGDRYPALSGLTHLPAPGALLELLTLELGKLIEDTVRKLTFRAIVAMIIEGS
jgi:hypothetical protein